MRDFYGKMDRLGTRLVGKVRGSKLKGEITWWRIGDWKIVGERRGWQIKGVANRGGALYVYITDTCNVLSIISNYI